MKQNTGLCLIRHIILNCSGVLHLLLSAVLLTFTFLPHSHQKLMAYWRPQVQGQRSSFQKFLWMWQLKEEVTWDFHINTKVTSTETLRWAWPELCYDFTFIPQVPVYRGRGAAGEYVCTRQHRSTALTVTHNNKQQGSLTWTGPTHRRHRRRSLHLFDTWTLHWRRCGKERSETSRHWLHLAVMHFSSDLSAHWGDCCWNCVNKTDPSPVHVTEQQADWFYLVIT